MELTESHPSATRGTAQPPAPGRSRRFVTGVLLAALLSAITGVISYRHGLDVARWLGNGGLVAYLIPLVPDLMIATSSLTLLEASAVKAPRPAMSMIALVAGIGWTVAMNVAAGWREGAGGAVLNAGVPLAFVLTFESLLWLIRRGRAAAFPESTGGGPAASSQPQPPEETAQPPVPAPEPPDTLEALRVLLDTDSQRKLAALLGVDRNKIQAWSATVKETADPAEDTPDRDRDAGIPPVHPMRVPVTSTSGPPAGAAQEGRPPSEHARLGAQPAAGMNGAGGHG